MRRTRTVPLLLLALAQLVALTAPVGVLAASSSNSNVSHSYATRTALRGGTIVSTVDGATDTVEATNTQNSNRITGIVVDPADSLLAVDPDAHKVQVAMSGTANVLVSTINGDIAPGDRIVASPLSGIGMKALGDGYMIGTAEAGFNAQSKSAAPQKVTDKKGKSQTVVVGYLTLRLAPGFSGPANGGVTGPQRWVRSLTGHTVAMPRIIASLIITVVTITAVVVLMYAGIYGSIISIGRNPLARASILQGLTQVLIMAALGVSIAFTLVYLLLR